MRLIDALIEAGKDTSKFVVYHNRIGIRYNKERDIMVYCDSKTGKYSNIESTSVWSYRNLFDDGWKVKTIVNPKYKIGDRFLLPHLFYDGLETNGSISHTTLNNAIGEIMTSYYDGKEMRYTVSLDGKGFPLLLTEDYLNKLDMVVSQD